jgi:hypothetical protein
MDNYLETNQQTLEHIQTVRGIMHKCISFLIKKAFSHDQSKLDSPEVEIFAEYTPKLRETTYGSDQYKQFLKEMKPALDHHYAVNRHHPEHFENGIPDMNLFDITEMLCDWYAATKRHADGDIQKSIELNKERFGIDDQLVQILKNTIRVLLD